MAKKTTTNKPRVLSLKSCPKRAAMATVMTELRLSILAPTSPHPLSCLARPPAVLSETRTFNEPGAHLLGEVG